MPRTRKTRSNTPGLYVAYYRVSDPKQGISRLGLEAQREAVTRYVSSTKGTLAAEYTEIESGKRHENRPELQAAIAASQRLKATLVIAKLDRLARNVAFISGLMESAADFVACDMPQANKLTLHIMAAMAEHEREMISQRTTAGLAQVKREIQENGFRVSKAKRKFSKLGNPRWQESIGKAQAARHPARARAEIVSMLQTHQRQGKTLRQIAAAMNQLSLKTPSGADWHPSSVRAALMRAA